MPALLDACVKKLMAKGYNAGQAYAMCTKSLQDAGHLKKGTNKLTAQGRKKKPQTAGK